MATTANVQRAATHRRLPSRKATDTRVTSLVIPRKLHRRATVAAYDLNWSMAELVRAALEEWLDRHVKTERRGASA
jgi:predicted HicB family RNase H-like nuclease